MRVGSDAPANVGGVILSVSGPDCKTPDWPWRLGRGQRVGW
jgi:hypothetical protein